MFVQHGLVGVEILYAEKINRKLAGIAAKALECPNAEDDRPCEYGALKRIIFDDSGRPEGKTGLYVNGDIVINLKECFSVAKTVSEDDMSSPVLGAAWDCMLRVLFHELFHVWVDQAPDLRFEDKDEEEEAAYDFADRQIIMFSMLYDVEMPPAEEMGLFHDMALDWFAQKLAEDPDSEWVDAQRHMLQDGTVFVFADAPVVSFRQYIRAIAPWDYQQSVHWDKKVRPTWPETTTKEDTSVDKYTNAFMEAVQEAENEPAHSVPSPPAEATPTTPPPPPPVDQTPETPPAPRDADAPTTSALYDEDLPPEPNLSQYEQPSQVHHAYEPVLPPESADNHGIPMEDMIASMQAIYMRLNQVFFDKCTWNGAGSFGNPAGVLDGVSIADIPYGTVLVHSCETLNNMGQRTRTDCNGYVRGTVFAKKGLPAFMLFININGTIHRRTLVAQNPNTTSKSAESARRGDQIAWVINGDFSTADEERLRSEGKRASKFIAMIKNGRYITLK
jgi:hypothetical protein